MQHPSNSQKAIRATTVTLGLLVFLAAPGTADTATAAAALEEQEITVERVETGFVIAPDFKFTEVDDEFASLVGAYGGWVHDHRLLVGAGGYWLANGSRDFKLWYGGGVVEWFARPTRAVNFSLRGLVGGGSGTLSTPINVPTFGSRSGFDTGRSFGFGRSDRGGRDLSFTSIDVAARDDFLIVEPQANLFVDFTHWLRLGVGASYRALAGASLLGERLRGTSASVSIHLGSF